MRSKFNIIGFTLFAVLTFSNLTFSQTVPSAQGEPNAFKVGEITVYTEIGLLTDYSADGIICPHYLDGSNTERGIPAIVSAAGGRNAIQSLNYVLSEVASNLRNGTVIANQVFSPSFRYVINVLSLGLPGDSHFTEIEFGVAAESLYKALKIANSNELETIVMPPLGVESGGSLTPELSALALLAGITRYSYETATSENKVKTITVFFGSDPIVPEKSLVEQQKAFGGILATKNGKVGMLEVSSVNFQAAMSWSEAYFLAESVDALTEILLSDFSEVVFNIFSEEASPEQINLGVREISEFLTKEIYEELKDLKIEEAYDYVTAALRAENGFLESLSSRIHRFMIETLSVSVELNPSLATLDLLTVDLSEMFKDCSRNGILVLLDGLELRADRIPLKFESVEALINYPERAIAMEMLARQDPDLFAEIRSSKCLGLRSSRVTQAFDLMTDKSGEEVTQRLLADILRGEKTEGVRSRAGGKEVEPGVVKEGLDLRGLKARISKAFAKGERL